MKKTEISVQDKIADPRIAIRKRAKAKNGTCKVKIYNISDKKIEIPKETIIARIKENNFPKLEISITGNTQKWRNITIEADEDFSIKDINVNRNINSESITKLMQYLISDRDIFREKLRKGDKYSGHPAKVTLKKGVAPKQARMYLRPPRDHEIIDQMMGQFMDTRIMETCEDVSDWRGHAVLQKKKDGKTRFTCDFRHMGPETCEKYQHPLPLIQEILDNLRGVQYFTKIDFTDGYFHIPIKAKYRKLFAFATRRGVFQWT
jgi:hypothetical protein